VKYFGGDRSKITIFGSSAGGQSVLQHLVQKESHKYYSAAIIQSGSYNVTGSDSEESYTAALTATQCADLACMLSKDAATLADEAFSTAPSRVPCIDGVALPASPWELIKQGKHKKVPVIIGASHLEDGAFMEEHPYMFNETHFNLKHADLNLTKIRELYDFRTYPYRVPASQLTSVPDGQKPTTWWAMSAAVQTDRLDNRWVDSRRGHGYCGARQLARHLEAGGSTDIYAYYLAVSTPPFPYTRHGADAVFVFGPSAKFFDTLGAGAGGYYKLNSAPTSLTGEETPDKSGAEDAAAAMTRYWASLAVSGAPSHDLLPVWPKYTAESDTVMRFNDPLLKLAVQPMQPAIETEVGTLRTACDYWDSLAPTAEPEPEP
jgi:carboxylesterase type B